MQTVNRVPLLYVENAPYHNLFAKDLESHGFEVTICLDSETASAALEHDLNYHEVALVDLGLPARDEGGKIVKVDDIAIGVDLLIHLRERRPDIALIGYSLLPPADFTRQMITQLLAARVSIVPFKLHGTTEDLYPVLRVAMLGYVVHPPQLAPLVAERLLPPNLLDRWEYRILEMRVFGKTLDQICDETGTLLETLRSDFDSIYGKLEDNGIIDKPLEGERRDPKALVGAYRALRQIQGQADQTWPRPARRSQYQKRGS